MTERLLLIVTMTDQAARRGAVTRLEPPAPIPCCLPERLMDKANYLYPCVPTQLTPTTLQSSPSHPTSLPRVWSAIVAHVYFCRHNDPQLLFFFREESGAGLPRIATRPNPHGPTPPTPPYHSHSPLTVSALATPSTPSGDNFSRRFMHSSLFPLSQLYVFLC